MDPGTIARIEHITGTRVTGHGPLSGGCVGRVYRVRLADGRSVVAKVGIRGSGLDIVGYMLRFLGRLGVRPVPEVLDEGDDFLLMTCIEAGDDLNAEAQAHAAELLAALHATTADHYGLERDTLIGGLVQPNTPSANWVEFFREHRLLYMAREAARAGRMPERLLSRITQFAARLETYLDNGGPPALIHGDMWAGNILVRKGRIASFIDPAIYYADAEIELAFSTLFPT
ncbi:MAG: fructosamine kinase family protein, partial [Alphaproteobacteria bacterium]|nr:fructosamine kinase family protein [Alphaproteobacteria bacterium]